MNDLIVEIHYADGDVGAHDLRDYGDDLSASASRLWALFAEGSEPSHIVIRPPSDEEGRP